VRFKKTRNPSKTPEWKFCAFKDLEIYIIIRYKMSVDASTTNAVVSELSLVEQISKIEESLKSLKRAARHELKNRRRRRGVRKEGAEKGAKGETPAQLVAWHTEVRKVWEEMRKSDAKTPYKRAVAEASARRKGSATPADVAPAKVSKKATTKVAEPVAAPVEAKKRVSKKA